MAVSRFRGIVAGDYREHIDRIGAAYDALPVKGAAPFATRHGFIMRECYLLVRQFRGRAGGPAAIKRFSQYDKRDDRQPEYRDNPFYWGIRSVRNDFSTSSLLFFAKQLKYADKHDVLPEYLIGFLLQMGANRNRMKTNKLSNEDEFNLFRIWSRRQRI